jgi:endonuclease/exonuclease/phosphatase family metal-dependent hydrolase
MKLFKKCVPAIMLWMALLSGCVPGTDPEPQNESVGALTIMTWNAHNLFDGIDAGTEYDEFRTSAGWSQEKYLGRLNVIASAIGRIQPLPDVIVLQEIENLQIMNDLSGALSGYEWTYFAGNPGAALGIGIMSRFPLMEARAHSISIGGVTTPRPVLETRIDAGEASILLFACHWKSKIGGDDTTEEVRRLSAQVILRRIRELEGQRKLLPALIAGDLNENHDEFFRRGGTAISALLPDDPRSAALAAVDGNGSFQKDFIVISGQKPPAASNFPQGAIAFYSPWGRELENGSYYYRGCWETIDHFLVSGKFFDNEGWEFESCDIINQTPFVNQNGQPVSYNIRTGSGFSDHLPLLLTLKFIE